MAKGKESIKRLQTSLRLLKKNLEVDGHLGRYTYRAFQEIDEEYVEDVKFLVGDESLNSLLSHRHPNWIPVDVARAYAAEAYTMFSDLPKGTLELFLTYEPNRQERSPDGPVVDANSVSPSGKHRGLYQFGRPAWKTAQKVPMDNGLASPISGVPYHQGVHDPRLNTIAAAAYATHHGRQLRSKGLEPTPILLYLMHNQGAGILRARSLKDLPPGYFEAQSAPVKELIVSFFNK